MKKFLLILILLAAPGLAQAVQMIDIHPRHMANVAPGVPPRRCACCKVPKLYANFVDELIK
jgi:hypothetical protein